MGNIQVPKKIVGGRESRYHCIRNRARPDITAHLQTAQDENDILKHNMLRISEYTHSLGVSNTCVHLPDFETLCMMIENYEKTKPVIELHEDDVSESESQMLELTPRLGAWPRDSSPGSVPEPAPASSSQEELESESESSSVPNSDISSESSDGVGFLHDFDKLMRRYSI
jgi:hypothetical protein